MTSEQKMVKKSFFNLRNKLIKSFEKIDGGKFNIKSISQIKKEGNAPIIDIAIQNDFLVLTTFRKVILYRYTGVFFEKIQEKVYKDLPNHSEILWKDRVLYFNNQDHLYTIQLDTSRYNQTYSVIKI